MSVLEDMKRDMAVQAGQLKAQEEILKEQTQLLAQQAAALQASNSHRQEVEARLAEQQRRIDEQSRKLVKQKREHKESLGRPKRPQSQELNNEPKRFQTDLPLMPAQVRREARERKEQSEGVKAADATPQQRRRRRGELGKIQDFNTPAYKEPPEEQHHGDKNMPSGKTYFYVQL